MQLMDYLSDHKEIGTKAAAEIWNVSARTARTRLRSLVKQGQLVEIGTGPKDPKKVYVLK
jgi:DeoR/GlpR family transcriptional regulator of sugar metabolism